MASHQDSASRSGATRRRSSHEPGSPVVSYCGVLLHDEASLPFGTLCHFDLKPCDAPAHDLELLIAVSPAIFRALRAAQSSS